MPPEGPRPRPPRPKRVDAITRRHGLDSADPYAWLKAANWPEVLRDPATLPADIRGALEAEDAYAREVLAPLAPMRRRLVEEMRARMEDEDVDAPTPDGPWEYYCRHREGGQHEIVCRRPRGGGEEEVLLDADRISRGRPYFELHAAQHSPDHRLLAWSSDDAGAELRTIRVRDLVSGRDLPDVVGDTTGIVAWSRDARWFLYVAVDANHRASRVLRHRIGEPVAADAAVYEEADPAWLVDLDSTLSGDHAVVAPRAQDATEIRLVDLSGDGAATRLVLPRKAGVSRRVEVCGDRLIVLHDDGAPDFRIDSLALDDPSAPGRTLVPEVAGRTIRDFVARRDRLAWLEMEDATPRLRSRAWDGGAEDAVAATDPCGEIELVEGAEFDAPALRYAVTGLTRPWEVRERGGDGEETALKRQILPSGYDPSAYVSTRLHARAADGAEVPISLVRRADRPPDGTAPLLLHAYGAYGDSVAPTFSSHRLSLLDRGMTYAIAHVRGGSEKGAAWREGGRLRAKANSVGDFLACAARLVETGHAAQGRIVARGASAGGIVVGAALNRAPGTFAGIVADVPFVDVLNTALDPDLPLTPIEWREWGDPIRDAGDFAAILAYSPYDNVRPARRPPVLAIAGLADPRVTYWEPAKWVARLRETQLGDAPALLALDFDAGHGGPGGRFAALEEIALVYAFALSCVGLADED